MSEGAQIEVGQAPTNFSGFKNFNKL